MKKIARRTFLASIPAAGLSLTPSLLASIPKTYDGLIPVKFDGIYLGDVLQVSTYKEWGVRSYPQRFLGNGLVLEHEIRVDESLVSWTIWHDNVGHNCYTTGSFHVHNPCVGHYIKLPPVCGSRRYREDGRLEQYAGMGFWEFA